MADHPTEITPVKDSRELVKMPLVANMNSPNTDITNTHRLRRNNESFYRTSDSNRKSRDKKNSGIKMNPDLTHLLYSSASSNFNNQKQKRKAEDIESIYDSKKTDSRVSRQFSTTG